MVKNSPASAGDARLIPGLGRSPGEGNGNPLQHSCLRNPMDRESGWPQSMGSQRVGHSLVTKQQQVDGGTIIVLRNGVVVRKIMFYQMYNKVCLFCCVKISSSSDC